MTKEKRVEADKRTPLSIRQLMPADAAELLRFYESLPPDVVWQFQPFAEVNEQVMSKHLNNADDGEEISLGLTSRDGSIEGHAFIRSVRKDRPGFGIGLMPRAQGRGWGRKLMQAVMDEADRLELPMVKLIVMKHNHAAKTLYEKMGFEIKGEATSRAENDCHYMERIYRQR